MHGYIKAEVDETGRLIDRHRQSVSGMSMSGSGSGSGSEGVEGIGVSATTQAQ